MSKNIDLKKSYSFEYQSQINDYVFPCKYSGENTFEGTVKGSMGVNIVSSLDTDVDVFTEIPDDIYKNKDASLFLEALRQAIAEENPKNVTLSKLIVSEQTDTGCTLDWIYNYFRLYFSFDKNEGDYFGLMSHNLEDGSYKNEFKQMKPTDFGVIARAMLNYVIIMIQG